MGQRNLSHNAENPHKSFTRKHTYRRNIWITYHNIWRNEVKKANYSDMIKTCTYKEKMIIKKKQLHYRFDLSFLWI